MPPSALFCVVLLSIARLLLFLANCALGEGKGVRQGAALPCGCMDCHAAGVQSQPVPPDGRLPSGPPSARTP